MKLLCIDVDQIAPAVFFDSVKSKLETELLQIETGKLTPAVPHKYDKFVNAGFALEDFIFAGDDAYWTSNKPYTNVLLCWGNYDTTNIEFLKPYLSTFNKDLIVLPNSDNEYPYHWMFGNIIAITKWSQSLFKIDESVLTIRDWPGHRSYMTLAIWYALRIGLDVQLIDA